MEHTIESKFNIEDVVHIKGTNVNFFIESIQIDICCAGPQVHYLGIDHLTKQQFMDKDKITAPAIQTIKRGEITLEEIQND